MSQANPIHVVLVPAWWPSPEQPYAGVFWTDYARAFAAAGMRVGVVVPDLVSVRYARGETSIPWRPQVSHETLDEIPVVRVRGLHTAFRMPFIQMHRFARWLGRGMRAYAAEHGQPNVLHAMCAIPSGWACACRAVCPHTPVVTTEQTGAFGDLMTRRNGGPYIRAGLAAADAVVTVSEFNQGVMRKAGIDRKIAVCGNPVSDVFTRASIPARRREGPVRALYVGRLVESKGIRELADAAAAVAVASVSASAATETATATGDSDTDANTSTIPSATAAAAGRRNTLEWHIVGDGPLTEFVRQRFQAAGLSSRLTLHGRLDRDAIARLMLDCDFLVHPTHRETFGMVVAEALCAGLPVLTTRRTACGEFIEDEEDIDNGLLVPPRDSGALANGLLRMAAAAAAYDRPAIAAGARSRFSAADVAAWYGKLFRSLIR